LTLFVTIVLSTRLYFSAKYHVDGPRTYFHEQCRCSEAYEHFSDD
jgi:hypothetical protein